MELFSTERVKSATLFYSKNSIEHQLMHIDLSDRENSAKDTSTFSFSKYPIINQCIKDAGGIDFYFKFEIDNNISSTNRKVYIKGFIVKEEIRNELINR